MTTEEPFVPPPGSIFHVQKIEEFGKRIHSLLSTSSIASSYKFTEVFLLDRWVDDDKVTGCYVVYNHDQIISSLSLVLQ